MAARKNPAVAEATAGELVEYRLVLRHPDAGEHLFVGEAPDTETALDYALQGAMTARGGNREGWVVFDDQTPLGEPEGEG